MTDLRSELTAKWREVELAGKSNREWRGIALEVHAPLALLAGIREPDGRISLLLEAPIEAAPRFPLQFQADGVSLADQRRPDEGIFRLAVTLENEKLRDVFEVLAADIVDVVRPAGTAMRAVTAAAKRLEAWQACLRSRRLGLSREEQTGLIGELAVLRLLGAEIGYPLAIESWKGPQDGVHDFKRLGIAVEVKTVVGASSLLHVSHLAQLETSGVEALVIARARFREGPDGKSIFDAVQEIREELREVAPPASASFDEKLLRLGYLDVDRGHYEAIRFVLVELYGLAVRDAFPRLTATSMPAGIVDCSYVIDERAATDFHVKADEFRKLLARMADSRP